MRRAYDAEIRDPLENPNISPGAAERYHGRYEVSRGIVGEGVSRHSVVDVGSNTIHLLVGEVDDGAVLPITGEKVSARLGAGVEKTGRLDDERLVLAREHGLAPERARVLPAAITTLATVLELFGKRELTVARGGIREGTLLALDEGEVI